MARLIRYFAVNPEASPYGRELERATKLSPASLKNEIDRLTDLGLLVREQDGRLVRYRANESSPLWTHFRALVRQFSAPKDVLPYALEDVEGVEAAFIFGSFAKGRDREDSDVDVLVCGEHVDDRALSRHALEASVLLGREVNVVHVTPEEFRVNRVQRRFFRDIAREPKQWLLDRTGLNQELELTA
jgi:predicted nucleotidyltransferase